MSAMTNRTRYGAHIMLGTSARLLRLLTLLQSRRAWHGPELAEQLDVTSRTLRRDVDKLRELGYPVDASPGIGGGYRLGAGAELPPLRLDDDEALAVTLGLRTTAGGPVGGMAEAALRCLTKLEQVMPSALRERVRTLQAAVTSLGSYGPPVDADLLTGLAQASQTQRVVRFAYRDAHGRETAREVEALGVVHTGPRWYLVAFDRARDDFRTFRVDRMTELVTTELPFTRRDVPGGDLAAYVSRSVGSEPYPARARVILHRAYRELRHQIPQSVGILTELDDDRCLFETGGASYRHLALHLAWLGAEVEVLDPPELVGAMAELAEALQRNITRSNRQ